MTTQTQVFRTEEALSVVDTLKLALEALKKSDGFLYNWHENYSDDEADAYAAARQLNEQAIIAAEKALAQQCVCGEPNSAGTHRTDGPCLAPQPEQHQDWCASLTQLLMSMPPKPAPCNCKPPQRTWVGLTGEDIRQLEKENTVGGYHGDYCPTWDLIEATEAKLKEKNT